jgi:hypothetical protein
LASKLYVGMQDDGAVGRNIDALVAEVRRVQGGGGGGEDGGGADEEAGDEQKQQLGLVGAALARQGSHDRIGGDDLDVRTEPWYDAYLHRVVEAINNRARQFPDKSIVLVGIEGDVKWGQRTKQEWTFLQEDIDEQVVAGTVAKRPQNMRIPFGEFASEVERLACSGKHVLVASCPARLGENRNVMNDAEAVISGQPWSGSVDIVFSRAGSAASNLFPNMSYDEEIATTAE